MAKPESRISEKRREYRGEKEAEALVNWLNITSDKKGKERIIRVFDLYLSLKAHYASAEYKTIVEDGYRYVKQSPQDMKKSRELHDALNTALSYYQMMPFLYIAPGGRSDWWVEAAWRPILGSKMSRDMERAARKTLHALSEKDRKLPGAAMWESGAIKRVIELIESGGILRIRRCRCDRFYFQKFEHQRFCSEKCRIAEFQKSDEARLKRNAYARELYHSKKALEEGKRRI
jgi:hypothetical protein